jgi:Ser/Thr protein kinase RdoA (MazF antagonist)
MTPVIELIGIVLLPTAVGCAVIYGARLARWAAGKRPVERLITRPVPVEPIERLGARLGRLHAELEDLENRSDVPVKGIRLRAVRGAYLDLLRTACERLEVSPPPPGDHVPQAEIYRVEAGLRERGLDVRAAATR